MEALQILSLALGAAWASGINLYATVLVLGALNAMGIYVLPEDLQILSSPVVLGAAAIMFCAEFLADKIPGFDSLWDALHTFIRIPAGALMAAGAVGGLDGAIPGAEFMGEDAFGEDLAMLAALATGGAVATTSHLSKATSRAVINTSPEPVTNWIASLVEDVVAVAGIFLAVFSPIVFLSLLGGFILLAIWLLPKLWRAMRRLLARLGIGSSPKEQQRPGFSAGIEFGRPKGSSAVTTHLDNGSGGRE